MPQNPPWSPGTACKPLANHKKTAGRFNLLRFDAAGAAPGAAGAVGAERMDSFKEQRAAPEGCPWGTE